MKLLPKISVWILIFLVGCSSPFPFLTDPRPKPSHVYSVRKADSGVVIKVSNVRIADPTPQQKVLIANICVDNPHHYALSIEGQLAYPGGEQDFGQGISSNGNPSCEDFKFNFSPDDNLSHIEFDISSITNWSYTNNKQLECAQVTDAKRLLAEWKTGIIISCQKNGSFNQWLESIDYVPPTMTQQELVNWMKQADDTAFDDVLVTHGGWTFLVSQDDIYEEEMLKLLGPNKPSQIQQNLAVQARNLRRDGNQIDVDICLNTPLLGAGAGGTFWDAYLKYNTERIKSFDFEPRATKNCGVISFKPPDGESIHQATLIVNGVSSPPDMGSEKGCKEYVSKLQEAIDKRYFGVWVVCNESDEGGWHINYITKPFWMSDFDARWLIQSDELYTIRGNWSFNLTLDR